MWTFVGVKLVVQKKQSTDVHVVCDIPAGTYVIFYLIIYNFTLLVSKEKKYCFFVSSVCPV
jgi:hypothetical protein